MTRLVTGLLSYYAVTLILKAILNHCLPGAAATILATFIQTFYVTFVFPWWIKLLEHQTSGDMFCEGKEERDINGK